MNVVDSSAWLEFFRNGPNLDFFSSSIRDVHNLIVPTITLFEVYKRMHQVSDEATAFRCIHVMRRGNVVPLDNSLALQSARYSIEKKLPLADSIIYTTAILYKAVLWTQEAHFKRMAGVEFCEAIKV
ncbi:MAG TPA: type II toxin-antitoxin system VapC family toxin [Candidatus Kapabacteria bacterium]|jgi:predicted nucleic acid-binding protein|nr:type II toxin-antitoxin system VapC family toxin [Candidatus Kapabacteria bacterium]